MTFKDLKFGEPFHLPDDDSYYWKILTYETGGQTYNAIKEYGSTLYVEYNQKINLAFT